MADDDQQLSIEYELIEADLMALQKHAFWKGPGNTSIRSNYKRWIVLFAALLALFMILGWLLPQNRNTTASTDSGPWWIWIIVIVVVWFIVFRQIRKQHGSLKVMLKDGNNKGLIGRRTAYITPEWFGETSMLAESRTKWPAIDKVDTTKDHLFVYVGTRSAFMIPKRAFPDEAAFKTFADTAFRYHQAAAPGLCRKCGYDLTGNSTGRCSECGETFRNEPAAPL